MAIIISMTEIVTGRTLERAALDLPAIGRRLVAARVAAGLTPTELCRRAGLTTSTLANWESGANRPRVDQLGRILPILRVTSDFVFYGVDAGLAWEVREAIAQALAQLPSSSDAGRRLRNSA
jgi:transcriptional regulator with XRE-family HTH domain